MAAGFLLKQAFKGSFVAAAAAVVNNNLFTVPANHIYLIKKSIFALSGVVAGGNAISAVIHLSDTAGANFLPVTDLFFATAANAGYATKVYDLTSKNTDGTVTLTPVANVNIAGSLENIILEAGQIFRLVRNSANAALSNITVVHAKVDVVDYTIS